MNATFLRIHHNGNVLVKNPHWHLGVDCNGKLNGEVLPCESVRRKFREQLTEAETGTLFQTADEMSLEFPPVEQHTNHSHDDICVQGHDAVRILYRYIIPSKDQQRVSIKEFVRILSQSVEKHAK
jgi:hypothetical protein